MHFAIVSYSGQWPGFQQGHSVVLGWSAECRILFLSAVAGSQLMVLYADGVLCGCTVNERTLATVWAVPIGEPATSVC